MNTIHLNDVTLAIGGRHILSGISLAIEAGEFIGILGANGAGKTTLLRALLGLARPVSGTISVLGEAVRRGNPAIGYLPQTRQAPTAVPVSGSDFLAASLNGNRWGLPSLGRDAHREVARVLDLVNAGPLGARPLSEMSGGERQRLLIAGALMGQPKILLLDEPLIGLDPYHQHIIVDLVRALSRDLKLTVLFTAHELNQLLGSVDRLLYLGHGQAALGTVSEVVRPDVLSRIYGAPIEVVRAGDHVFVMSHGQDIERDHSHDPDRPHDHSDHPHAHHGHHHHHPHA